MSLSSANGNIKALRSNDIVFFTLQFGAMTCRKRLWILIRTRRLLLRLLFRIRFQRALPPCPLQCLNHPQSCQVHPLLLPDQPHRTQLYLRLLWGQLLIRIRFQQALPPCPLQCLNHPQSCQVHPLLLPDQPHRTQLYFRLLWGQAIHPPPTSRQRLRHLMLQHIPPQRST